jgi:hypothetical protein
MTFYKKLQSGLFRDCYFVRLSVRTINLTNFPKIWKAWLINVEF